MFTGFSVGQCSGWTGALLGAIGVSGQLSDQSTTESWLGLWRHSASDGRSTQETAIRKPKADGSPLRQREPAARSTSRRIPDPR